MPASSTGRRRAASRRRIASRFPRVCAGSRPRSASFAPSSRITASASSVTDQSIRASPSAVVSPETPALTTSAAIPFRASARCRRAGKAASAGSPSPAVSESPNATIFTGRPALPGGAAAETSARTATAVITASIWTVRAPFPYERGSGRSARPARKGHMNDTSAGAAAGAIALAGINLALGRGAARVHILKDIDLHIARGEAVGLIGPSGSGKSTLLMVMAGLARPDAPARVRGRNVGIVFQSFHLIPTMTALENVAVPLELAGHDDAFARAARELEAVGLADRVNHYPAELSGGEQQRVALARALAPNPAILVADEPTGNLDEATGQQIIDLMFAGQRERGTTLVLVTHDAA